MSRTWTLRSVLVLVTVALAVLAVPAALALAPAWAQVTPAPGAPTPPSSSLPATTPAAGGGNAAAGTVILLGLALVVIVGVGVKFYDLKRKREADAVHLQAQLSDALLREPGLSGLPVTPTAQVSLFKRSPATVEVSGQVPTAEEREHALSVIRAEAARIRPDVVIEDRMAIVPSMAERVA
jgi:hypothetical protein